MTCQKQAEDIVRQEERKKKSQILRLHSKIRRIVGPEEALRKTTRIRGKFDEQIAECESILTGLEPEAGRRNDLNSN